MRKCVVSGLSIGKVWEGHSNFYIISSYGLFIWISYMDLDIRAWTKKGIFNSLSSGKSPIQVNNIYCCILIKSLRSCHMQVVTQSWWPNIASSHWCPHNTDSHITTPSTPSLALSNWVWWDFVTYANPPQLHHPQIYARLPHSLTVIITPLGMQAQVASWRCHSDKSPPLWPSHTQMWSKHGIWMKKKVSHDVHPIVCLLQCQ